MALEVNRRLNEIIRDWVLCGTYSDIDQVSKFVMK